MLQGAAPIPQDLPVPQFDLADDLLRQALEFLPAQAFGNTETRSLERIR